MSALRMTIGYGIEKTGLSKVDVGETLICFEVIDLEKDKEVIARLTVDLDDLPEANQRRTLLYGLNKKLTDSTSEVGKLKGKVAKIEAMTEYWKLLLTNEWAKERVIGAPVTGPEVEALAQLKELTVPQAQAALAAYDKDTRAKILAHEDVVKLAGEIRAARKEAEVMSLDDMI